MARRDTGLLHHGGEQIAYDDCGDSTDVAVLVHGAGGNRTTWWQQVPALVAAGFRVVTLDTRGSGRSTDATDEAGPVSTAGDLEALRRHLDVDAWHVVGHSAGGWPALRYAIDHPARTRSTTLVGSVAGVFPAEVDAWWREMTARLAATGWAGHSELARSPSLADAYCDTSPAGAYLYQLIAGLNPPPSMTGPAMRVRDVDLTADEIASVATPVHFVVGARDIAIPPAACRAAAREVPGASFTELAGLGHVCFFEAPEVFNPWLVDVLRSPAP